MSSYYDDDEPRRYRNVQTRPRERGEPDYVREETYIERGKGPGPARSELVRRGREDSIEDIPRDFPPPRGADRGYNRRSSYRSEYDDYGYSRRSKSAAGRRYSDDYEDDRYTDYGPAAAAGAAGYATGRRRDKSRDRRRRRKDRDYDSEYSDSRSPSPRRDKERRKSGVEELLGGLGLGGIAGALAGKSKDRDRSDSRSVKSGRSRSRVSRRRRSSSDRSSSRALALPTRKRTPRRSGHKQPRQLSLPAPSKRSALARSRVPGPVIRANALPRQLSVLAVLMACWIVTPTKSQSVTLPKQSSAVSPPTDLPMALALNHGAGISMTVVSRRMPAHGLAAAVSSTDSEVARSPVGVARLEKAVEEVQVR